MKKITIDNRGNIVYPKSGLISRMISTFIVITIGMYLIPGVASRISRIR